MAWHADGSRWTVVAVATLLVTTAAAAGGRRVYRVGERVDVLAAPITSSRTLLGREPYCVSHVTLNLSNFVTR
jgi:hypothetical protein